MITLRDDLKLADASCETSQQDRGQLHWQRLRRQPLPLHVCHVLDMVTSDSGPEPFWVLLEVRLSWWGVVAIVVVITMCVYI